MLFKSAKKRTFGRMNVGLLQEVKRTVSALYPELADEALFLKMHAFTETSAAATNMKERAAKCTDCALHVGRTNSVYGEGSNNALVAFIGDFPSADDDHEGKIFSDQSGALLNRMIAAMNLRADNVYKTNLVKCAPPQSRAPRENEVRICAPYLESELQQANARMIVALGESAGQFFCRSDANISHLRGQWYEFRHFRVMVTHHPRELLKDASKKKEVWDDLKLVMKELGL